MKRNIKKNRECAESLLFDTRGYFKITRSGLCWLVRCFEFNGPMRQYSV